jgi:hypothetical protein
MHAWHACDTRKHGHVQRSQLVPDLQSTNNPLNQKTTQLPASTAQTAHAAALPNKPAALLHTTTHDLTQMSPVTLTQQLYINQSNLRC